MPITMFDSLQVLYTKGIEPYLKLADSLGRTALHRLVMIHTSFFVYSDEKGNMQSSRMPCLDDSEMIKRVRDHFDFDAKDIYGKTAEDYYNPMKVIYGKFLSVLFDPNGSNVLDEHIDFISGI
jgi:hypothetical protein